MSSLDNQEGREEVGRKGKARVWGEKIRNPGVCRNNPSSSQWINGKIKCGIYIPRNIIVLKYRRILIHVTTWINFGNVHGVKSARQYNGIPLHEVSR